MPPTYDLQDVKRLFADPSTRIIRRRDRKAAADLGYADDDEMAARINKLQPSEFHKTMESEDFPGLWQDVYKSLEPAGHRLYIKLQIDSGAGVIITFKRA